MSIFCWNYGDSIEFTFGISGNMIKLSVKNSGLMSSTWTKKITVKDPFVSLGWIKILVAFFSVKESGIVFIATIFRFGQTA